MATTFTPTIKKIYRMTEFDLLRTKVAMGNMYMCVDTQKLYYDGGNTADDRRLYSYISIRTTNELFYQITPTFGKSYYCWEDNSLWIWLNKWQSLYSETTYPSAYVYDDIPSKSNPQNINEIYRYDMPNMPADDNGLLKDGSVIVRDRNRLIKAKLSIDDETNNLLISSYFGGGMRFLPNGKMSSEGELLIDSIFNEETEKTTSFATLRASLTILNDEMYIDYSEDTSKDTNKYQNSKHRYKVYHEGNLDISNVDTITSQQVYQLLLDTDELPNVLDFNVSRLDGHEADYFANAVHRHNATDVDGLYDMVIRQSGVAVRSIFNNMDGVGINGSYDTANEVLTLAANNFRITLSGGVIGSNTVQGLSDTNINVVVDPDKHQHTNYEDTLSSLQNQINAIVIDTNTTYTKDVIDSKISEVAPTALPTPGKPLLVNSNRILPATSASTKQFDHNITLSVTGGITGSVVFNGSSDTIELPVEIDLSTLDTSHLLDNKEFAQIIGDDTNSSYVIKHNLNSKNLIVQIRDINTGEQVYITNTLLDDNTIQITSNSIIEQGSLIVLIYKLF